MLDDIYVPRACYMLDNEDYMDDTITFEQLVQRWKDNGRKGSTYREGFTGLMTIREAVEYS